MLPTHRTAGVVAGIAVLGLLAGSCAEGTTRPAPAVTASSCEDAARQTLAARGIGSGQIRSLSLNALRSGRDNRFIIGYEAWAGLASCSGSAVVNLDRSCTPTDSRLTGDCARPGVGS